jgi:hypothetical protein
MITDRFWTFLTTGIKVNTTSAMSQALEITGSFAYVSIESPETSAELEEDNQPRLILHPMTESDITLIVPSQLMKNSDGTILNPSDISARTVFDVFANMFGSLPFKRVPEAPSDLPIHQVPPTRRPAFLEALKNLK